MRLGVSRTFKKLLRALAQKTATNITLVQGGRSLAPRLPRQRDRLLLGHQDRDVALVLLHDLSSRFGSGAMRVVWRRLAFVRGGDGVLVVWVVAWSWRWVVGGREVGNFLNLAGACGSLVADVPVILQYKFQQFLFLDEVLQIQFIDSGPSCCAAGTVTRSANCSEDRGDFGVLFWSVLAPRMPSMVVCAAEESWLVELEMRT